MKRFQKQLILLMCISLATSGVRADSLRPRAPQQTPYLDVALSPSGSLAGQHLDQQGIGVADAKIILAQGESITAEAITSADGTYHIASLRPGVYQLTINGQSQLVRIWDTQSSPPAARESLTTVQRGPVVRGQYGTPLVAQIGLAIGIGAAVAAAIAISESRDAQQENDSLRDELRKVSSP